MNWEDVKHGNAQEVQLFLDTLELSTATARKRKYEKTQKKEDVTFAGGFVEEEEEEDSDVGSDVAQTPRKKRKTSAVSTPRKPKTPTKLLTPRHKKYLLYL